MSGRWTRIWDAERQLWLDVYLELPTQIVTGTATAASGPRPVLLGPDGKPIRPAPQRRVGFGRPEEVKP